MFIMLVVEKTSYVGILVEYEEVLKSKVSYFFSIENQIYLQLCVHR